MDFYDKIPNIKKTYKLNNSELGAHLGMTGDAFRMAAKRKSFSNLEIQALENLFDSYVSQNENEQKAKTNEQNEQIKNYGRISSLSELEEPPPQKNIDVPKEEINGYYYPNVNASAGLNFLTNNNDLDKIPIRVPNLEKGLSFINVIGDSMYPKYCGGEIIGVKEVSFEYVIFGYTHVIILNNGEIYMKYIHEGKDDDHWLFKSENSFYPDQNFHKSLIHKIFKIKAVITKTSM